MCRKSIAEVEKSVRSHNSMPLIGITIGCMLAAVCGCIDLEHYGQEECIGLTYLQYIDRFALRDFDPVGAKRISYFGNTGRDSYDSLWRIEISRQGWVDICTQIGTGRPQPYNLHSMGTFGVPDTWPEPLVAAPDWWMPAPEFGSELVISQEQLEDGKRATGWYWLEN